QRTPVCFLTSPATAATSPRSLHDALPILTGIVSGFNPTNPVTFSFFANGTCAPTGAASGSGAVTSAANTVNSTTQSSLAAGSYAFNGRVEGTTEFESVRTAVSSCVPVAVSKTQLAISTQIH